MMRAGLTAVTLQRLQQALAISCPPMLSGKGHTPPRRRVRGIARGPVLVAGVVLLLVGCSSDISDSVPVSGTVTYAGAPVTVGEVVYTPKGDGQTTAGRAARGRIQSDGSFKMQTSVSVRGVVPGRYAVTIIPPGEHAAPLEGPTSAPIKRPVSTRFAREKKKSTIPDRYQRPESTDLEDVVDENHPGTITLELTD